MSYDDKPAMPQAKISQGSAGLGTVTPEMVTERARELALADGRREPNEKDLAEATQELVPGSADREPVAPELDSPEIENVTEWDTAPEASGERVTPVLPEDEANIGELLVQEGLEEADHASRTAAGEEFAPEVEEDEEK